MTIAVPASTTYYTEQSEISRYRSFNHMFMNNALRNVALLFAALFLFINTGYANVAVTVTYTGTAPGGTLVSGSPFSTLAAAVTALNAATFTGTTGVTLTCAASGAETAPIGGYSITTSGSATCAITINGNASTIITATGLTSGSLTDAVFKLVGASYITLQNFTMQENSANTTTTSASNNMTEWGVALLTSSTTKGSQNNTITGCTISLNKSYPNTFGVYSNASHSSTVPGTVANATSVAGTNSNNSVYGNNISNVNIPICFAGGYGSGALMDAGNYIGTYSGNSTTTTGNVLTNWGSTTTLTGTFNGVAGNFSGTSYTGYVYIAGILLNHQYGYNVQYNSITNAASTTANANIYGISADYFVTAPTGTFTNTISNNTITLNNAQVAVSNGTSLDAFAGIETRSYDLGAANSLSTGTMTVSGNSITGCTLSGLATTQTLKGIANSWGVGTLNISGNYLDNNSTYATTGASYQAISNTGAVVTAINILNNNIGNNIAGNATTGFTLANTTTINSVTTYGIYNNGGAATAALTITGNDFRNLAATVTASGQMNLIRNATATLSQNISANSFTSLNINTTGDLYFIYDNVTLPTGGSKTINSNTFNGTTVTKTSGGNVYFYDDVASSPSTITVNNNSNNFSDFRVSGSTSTSVYGWLNQDDASKTIHDNTFTVSGSAAAIPSVYGLLYAYSGLAGTNSIYNNKITFNGGTTGIGIETYAGVAGTIFNVYSNTISLSGSSAIYGIYANSATSGATNYIYSNTINGLLSSGANVYGIYTVSDPGLYYIGLNSSLASAGNTVNNLQSGTAAAYGIFTQSSQTNNISNNTVSNIAGTGTAATGIYIGGGTPNTISNNTVSNISITAASQATGILVVGATSSNNTISLNTVSGVTAPYQTAGISFGATTTTNNVFQNTVSNISTTGSGYIANGIIYGNATTNNVYRNKVYNIQGGTTGAAYGVTANSTSGTTNNIYNNIIGQLSSSYNVASYTMIGLSVGVNTTNTTNNVYYNTVYLSGAIGASAKSAALYNQASTTATTAKLVLIDNLLINNTTNGTKMTAFARSNAETSGNNYWNNYASTSDYNLFYTPSGTGYSLYYDGTNSYTTLAAYQAATVGTFTISPRDAHSKSEDETSYFINTTTGSASTYLHLNPSSASVCYNNGSITPAISTDYDGATRATYSGYAGAATLPTIGATEMIKVGTDAGVTALVLPSPLCAGAQTVQVQVTNFGTSTLSSVTVNWSVNGVAQTPVPFSSMGLASGATSAALTLGTFTFGVGTYVIVANTTAPNGGTDGNTANDAFTQSYSAGLSGTYTIGVTGANYTTLTAAAADYNAAPICGPVTFSILNNYSSSGETFPIQINTNSGASAINTLTIKPAVGASPVISGGSGDAIIAFNNAQYATLDGSNAVGGTTQDLTIINSSSIGIGVEIENGTVTNTVKNCNIDGGYEAGIALSNTAACTIANNSIYYSSNNGNQYVYGIYIAAGPASGTGHTITGNYVGGSATKCGGTYTNSYGSGVQIVGIYYNVSGSTAPVNITGNTISGISTNGIGANILSGIEVDNGYANIGATGTGNGNTITGITMGLSTSTTGNQLFGVYTAGTGVVNVVNNSFNNLLGYGTSTGSQVVGVYYNATGASYSVSNNAINTLTSYGKPNLDITSTSSGSLGAVVGIEINTTAAGATISSNTINTLVGASAATANYPAILGISADANGSGNIYGNKIYDLENTTTYTSTLPGMSGFRNISGTWVVYNNQIIINNKTLSGTVIGAAQRILGICDNNGKANQYYFNSVLIGGAPTTGAAPSAAFAYLKYTSAVTAKNNIFYNVRTNNGATGNNYAIGVYSGITSFTADYNDLYSAGGAANLLGIKGGNVGFTTGTTYANTATGLTNWKAAVPTGEANSLNQQVWFAESNPPITDLSPSPGSNCAIFGKGIAITTGTYPPSAANAGIAVDYTGTTSRNSPPDMGAIEFTSTFPTISAGPAQSACLGSTVTMAGTDPSTIDAIATGAWTPTTGITGTTLYNATYTGFTTGANPTQTWTVTDGSCTGNATVVITGVVIPQGSLAGNTVCAPGAGMLTWAATTGTGPYTIVYNNGSTNVTATGVVSGTAFATSPTNPSSNLNCTLVSVTDNGNAQACARTSGFTGGSATVTINSCSTNLTLASGTTFTGATYKPGLTSAINTTNANLLGFSLSATGACSVSKLVLNLTGANSSDYGNFRIIRDVDGSGTWNTGDVTVGTVSTYGATITFSGLSESINTTATQYLLVADVLCTSTAGNAITATMPVSGITTTATAGGTDQTGNAMAVGTLPATPANPTSNSPQCAGTGVTITSATNATADSWYWESAASGTSTTSAATSSENETTGGNYYIRAQNTYGCWSAGAGSVNITVNPAPQGSFTGNTVCPGGNGMLTWSATAGTGPYSVVYTSGGSVTVPGVVSGTAFASSPTTISSTTTFPLVSVTDANGCVATTGFTAGTGTITANPTPAITPGTPTSVCAGINSSLTYTGATNGPTLYSIVWGSGAATAGFLDVSSASLSSTISIATPATAVGTTYSGTLTVTNGTTTCNSTGYTINVTITGSPTAHLSANPSSAAICGSGNVIMTASGTGGNGTYTYSWSPTTNLLPVAGTSANETATPTTSTSYTVTVKDGNNCTATATQTVGVGSAVTVTATATPATVCSGGSSSLVATAVNNNSYGVSSIAYSAPTPVSPTTISSYTGGSDDGYTTVALPTGFAFSFYGTSYSNIYIGTNGYVTFTSGTTNNEAIPANSIPTTSKPVNMIAPFGEDLSMAYSGSISYFTTGTAPNRQFVISYNAVPIYNSGYSASTTFNSTNTNTGEIILNETSNIINVLVANSPSAPKVLGIQNSGGTVALAAPGRNYSSTWAVSTPEAWQFAPATTNYSWSPATYLSATNIYNPTASAVTATVPYTVVVTDASTGCSASAAATVTVTPLSASAGSNVTICPGASTTLTATPTGGCSPYTYNWGSGYTSTATNSVSPSSTTSYTVTIQDNNSTTASASVTVTVNPVVTAGITTSPSSAVSCAGSLVTLTAAGGGGSGTYTYAWSPTTNLSPVAGTSAIESATPTTNRTYTVTVKDGNNCTATATKTVTYTTLPTTQTVTGTSYAPCASGATLGLSGSQSGVSYQLTLAGVNQGSAVAGTGSAITLPGTHTAGSYVIVATNASGCTTNISATVTTTTILNGAVTVGTSGTYTTLTGATGLFNAINSGYVSGNIVATINSNITEPGTVALNQWTEVDNTCTVTATPSYTLTVQSDGTARTLSGNYSSDYLIRLQGADRVTFTGGTGAQHNLIFTNKGSGVFMFYDDCASDVLTNCDVQCGSGLDNNIHMYSSTNATASVTVSNNLIHDMAYATGKYAVDGIMVENSGCTPVISGNSIYNFTLYGVHVSESADNATVTGNNIYMVVSDVYTEAGIYDDATGNGHIITNNTIGGNGSGGNWSYTAASNSTGNNTEFDAIYYTGADGGVAATITGNTISNFNFSATSPPYFFGVHTTDGAVTVGSSANPNTISTVTVGASGAGDDEIYGVYVEEYGSADVVNVQYNTIHDLTSQGTTADGSSNIFSKVNGIFFGSFAPNGNVNNNTVYNLVSASRITNSIATINDDENDAVAGILILSNPTGLTVSSNTIYSLRSTTVTTKNTVVAGISISDGYYTASGTISSNKIYDLTNTSTATSTLPAIVGIRVYESAVWNVYNNQLILTNSTNTNGVRFYGISDYAGAACNYFYNSVYMGGGASSGTAVSACFNGFSSASSPTFYNNLMYNERTNTGSATGINYAVSFLGTTPAGFTSDYNDLYSVSTTGTTTYNNVGAKNSTSAVALSNWQPLFTTGGDAHSQSKKVLYSQSNPPTSDLTPNSATNCWLDGKGKPIVTPTFAIAVPKDYLNTNTRNTSTPDIGAIEFTSTANTTLTLVSGANSSTTSLAVCSGSSVSATATTLAPATLTYTWTTPDAVAEGNVSTFSRSVTTAMGGAYNLTVSDVLACSTTASATLVVNPLPTATISGTTSVCFNSTPVPNITFTGASGTPPYTFTYNINGGTSQTVTTSVGSSVNVAVPTTTANTFNYNLVSVQDASSTACSQSQPGTATVTVNENLTAVISGGTSPVCYNSSPGTFTATAGGGTGSYTYQWYNGAGLVLGQTNSTYNPGNLTSSNSYFCAVTSGSCGTVNTSITSITARSVTTATASNTGSYVVGQTISLSSSSSGAVTYQWSGPPSYTATGQNVTISGSTLAMSGTYTVTATNGSGCTATASTNVLVSTNATYVWTGATNTNWTVITNWSPNAPTGGPNACAADVIIPSVTNAPVITSAIQVGSVQIDAGAQITITATSLNVCKNWVGSTGATKAVIAGNGTVVLNGSSAQNVSGKTQIQELVIENSAGVNMQSGSAVDVVTALDLASGNFDATNGTLTFKSRTVDSVGILDNFSAGYTGTITGNITAERYYDASQTYDQHYMGSPVNTPSLSQFNASGTAGFVIPQQCDETRLRPWSPYGTVFSLHEDNGAICELQQWKVETTTSLPNAENAMGYSLLRAGAGTLVLNGAANVNSSYSVSGLTNSGWTNSTMQHRTGHAGWQLLSDPYLAPISLSSVPAGFDNQVQVWNADGLYANTYQPATIGVDANIAPFQAFMVHKTSAGGSSATFTINGSDRRRATYAFHSENSNQLNIVAANNATGKLDQTTVSFNAAATDSFDAQYDAAKLPGSLTRHTLYTVNGDLWMSRNTLHSIATTSTVPMGFEPGATSTYKLTFNGLNTFDPTSYIYLEDKALGVMYNVRNGDYAFTADSADNWDRFVLHFTPPAVISTTDANCTTAGAITIQQPGRANWNYTLTDAGNAIIISGTLNQSQQITAGVPAGTYTLTLIDTNNYTVAKTIVVGGAEMITAQFDAPVNAVQVNQNITLTSTTTNAANYQWNFGNGTSGSGAVTSVAYTQAGVYSVSLIVTNASGCTSTQTKLVTVNDATGLNNLAASGIVKIWSHSNKVYVDLTALQLVDANIIIYDILGEQISNERVASGNLVYQREIDNIDAAYFIVMVRNDDKITTKKVFITNSK